MNKVLEDLITFNVELRKNNTFNWSINPDTWSKEQLDYYAKVRCEVDVNDEDAPEPTLATLVKQAFNMLPDLRNSVNAAATILDKTKITDANYVERFFRFKQLVGICQDATYMTYFLDSRKQMLSKLNKTIAEYAQTCAIESVVRGYTVTTPVGLSSKNLKDGYTDKATKNNKNK